MKKDYFSAILNIYFNIVEKNVFNFMLILIIILILFLVYLLWTTKKKSKKDIEEKERFQNLFDNMNEGFALHEMIFDIDGIPIDYTFLEVNKSFEIITELDEAKIKNKTVKQVLPETEQYWIDFYGEVAKTGTPIKFQNYAANLGKYFSVNVYSPKLNQFATIFTDITEQIEFTQKLNKERNLFETTIDSLGDGVISTDKFGKIEIMNPMAESITGWKLDEAKGLNFEKVFNIIDEITKQPRKSPLIRIFETEEAYNLEQNTLIIRKDNSFMPIEDSVSPIKDNDGDIIGIVIVFRDFTDKKEKLEKISYLSYHDQLTGLYNRHFFEEELKRLDSSRNLPLSLVLLDVNGLKLTNDAFGHQIGDELLVKVADILRSICRTDDIISRVGGDEFVIMLPKTTHIEVENLVKRLYYAMDNSTMDNIIVSVSIGHKTKTRPEQTISEIFSEAEENMYRKKLTESQIMRKKTIALIFRNLNETNHEEKVHSQKVSDLCIKIGKVLGLEPQILEDLRIAGLMHDIGKIAINNKILTKRGKFNFSDITEIRRHTEIGYHILKSVDEYNNIADYVLSHHEKWNGTGYPRGLSGEDIPLIARIISIADAFESMTSSRSYKITKTVPESRKEIEQLAGIDFDPEIVKQLVDNKSFIW